MVFKREWMQMTERPGSYYDVSAQVAGPPEARILAALWRRIVPILLVSVLAALAVWLMTRSEMSIRTVQSEILVRMGYEYSPVPWSSLSETQQINFRADEVIGTEIQLLTSEGAIQTALAAAPHPEIGSATDGTFGAEQVVQVRKKLAVRRLEGSNVILVEVQDADPAWSIAFSQALLEAYLQTRARLFANPVYDQLLADDTSSAGTALTALDDEAHEISQRIGETVAQLTETASALAASPAQPELREALARDIRGLLIYVDGMANLSSLKDSLKRLDQVLTLRTSPGAVAGTGNLVSGDLLTSAVDSITADATRLTAIAAERNALMKELDTARTAQQRKSMRDGASNTLTVMTPPRVLAGSNGLDGLQKSILAGLMALILSALFFVFLDGLRRRGP